MAIPKTSNHTTVNPTSMTVHLCVPDDQARHLPKRRRAPHTLPRDVPVPRAGDYIYLSRNSAWRAAMVVFEWHSFDSLRVEVWLEHVPLIRHSALQGFALTQ